MTRFTMALTTAAIAAVAASGAMALQALGDGQAPSPDRAKLAKCLRGERGTANCKPDAGAAKPAVPEELLACLRAHGLNPPTAPDELKPWILRTPAAQACIAAPPKDAAPGCGEAKRPPVSGSRSGSAHA
jgi:hypothetical protein